MIHTADSTGLLVIPYCKDCGIRLPANYLCPRCVWELAEDADGRPVEVCIQPCLAHKGRSILRV